MSEKLTSQMTLEYRAEWSTWELVREIVQNALDETNTLPIITKQGDKVIVSDNGTGLSEGEFYLLGKTDKVGKDMRGKYGEGIKVGFVRLIAKGGTVEARSRDWICTLDVTEKFNEKVVEYTFNKTSEYLNGVKYIMTGINYDMFTNWIEERFVKSNDAEILYAVNNEGQILTGNKIGKLYVKDIYVGELPKHSDFGYNLYRLELNTDRNYPNYWDLLWRIGKLLSQVDDEEIIKQIINACRNNTLESDAHLTDLNEKWGEVVIKMFGESLVIGTQSELNSKVSYEGGTMITFKNEYLIRGLQNAGIPEASEYIKEKSEERRDRNLKSFYEISERKQEQVKIAWSMVQQLDMFENIPFNKYIDSGWLMFYDKYSNEEGFAETGGKMIRLAVGECHIWTNIFPTIVHELIHTHYEAEDLSTEMQTKTHEAFKKFVGYMGNYTSKTTLLKLLK